MHQKNEKRKCLLEELVQIKRPLLLLAGPGMGKTYALAYKIRYLVKEKKVCPEHITVITFTNEAATNMRKRISTKGDPKIYVEQKFQPTTICTMHKLGHRIIKDNCRKANLVKGFRVIPVDLRKIIASDCSQLIGAKRIDAEETLICRQNGKCKPTQSLKCRICVEYNNLLRRFNYIDFDDQIFLSTKILKENPQILIKEQNKAEFLLVDEYQDINYAQWELIKLLSCENHDNLFVVGDNYQSIYSFRGGDPRFIKSFSYDYAPNGLVRTLTKNYRCPPNIFKGAFHMVQNYNGGDIAFLEKINFIEEANTALIKVYTFQQQNMEAAFIANKINDIGPSYDALILVPTVKFSIPIRRALRKKHIDFSCKYDIEDTDHYLIFLLLRWLRDPTDNFNFRILLDEIINKGISDIPTVQTETKGTVASQAKREKALKHISNLWNRIEERKTLYTELKKLRNDELFTKLVAILFSLRKTYNKKESDELFTMILEQLKLWKKTKHFSREFVSIVEEMITLSTSSVGCSVRILTFNNSKGLGADYVFIVGVENNILPHQDSNESKIKEESRLFYVSMTRAKKELYILHSKERDRDITQFPIAGMSKFVDAVPEIYIDNIEIKDNRLVS